VEQRLSATELAKNQSSILSRVHRRGERFIVERNGEPVATIGPVEPSMGMTVRELFALLRRTDRPDDQFVDDLEAIQTEQGTAETPWWPS
jgi:antitoxin (DNA-binding transcriptional repressor) of toxin-antitoxin stability system